MTIARHRCTIREHVPSPSDFYKRLGLAEIYLEDGAPITALHLIREAMALADSSPAEGEDLGDVSTHILQRIGVRPW